MNTTDRTAIFASALRHLAANFGTDRALTLTNDEAKAVYALLLVQPGVAAASEEQEAEIERQRVAHIAGIKAVTEKSLPAGSTFTVTAEGQLDYKNTPWMRPVVDGAVCTVRRYRMRSSNGWKKTRELSFTFTAADGEQRDGILNDPRAKDVVVVAVAGAAVSV